MSKMLKTQELENARQANIIGQQELENIRQGEVINRLEEALTSSDQKCKAEVLENDKNKLLLNFMVFYGLRTIEEINIAEKV